MPRFCIVVQLFLVSFLLKGQTNFEFAPGGITRKYNLKGIESLSTPALILTTWNTFSWFLYEPSTGRFDGNEVGLKNVTLVSGEGAKTPCSDKLAGYTKNLASLVYDATSLDVFREELNKRFPSSPLVDEIASRPILVIDPQTHTDEIMNVLYSHSLKTIITLSKDKTIRLWDIESGENIRTIRTYGNTPEEGQYYRGALSSDGKILFAGGFMDKNKGKYVGDLKIYDLNSGEQLGVLGGSDNSCNTVAAAAGVVAAGYNDKGVYIWNEVNIKKAITEKQFFKSADKVFDSDVSGVSLSPDGKIIAVSQYANTQVYLAQIESEGDKVTLTNGKYLTAMHRKGLVSVAISPDGNYILSSDPDETILWNIKGEYMKNFAKKSLSPESIIRFSPSGKRVLLGNAVYEFPGGTLIKDYKSLGISYKVNNFVDDETVANRTSKDEILLWNVADAQKIKTIGQRGNLIEGVVFMPEGLKIVLSSFLPYDKMGKPTDYPADKHVAVFNFSTLKLQTDFLPTQSLSNLHSYKIGSGVLQRVQKGQTLDLDVLQSGNAYINPKRNYGTVTSFSYTPQGGNILVGFTLHLVLFDLDGNELKRFVGHTGEIKSIAFSPDGNYAVTLGADQTIRLWNLKDTGRKVGSYTIVKPVATLYINPDKEWICFNSENQYASSKKGARFIGFLENKGRLELPHFYTFEEFDLLLNRPDLLLKSIGITNERLINAMYAAFQRRLKRYQVNEADLKLRSNAINLVINTVSGKSETPNLSLSFRAKSVGAPIQRYEVYINDVRVNNTILTTPVNEISPSVPITLGNGNNKIQVTVQDKKGNKSAFETIRIHYAPKATKLPTLYFVSLAVAQYANATYNLTYPTKDAADLLKQMQAATGKIFSEVKVLSMNNKDVSKDALDRIKSFLAQSTVNDYVMVFVAGHGLIADRTWYFATSGTDFNKPELGGIAYEQLEGIFELVPARNRVMFIDACHSGELDAESLPIAVPEVSEPDQASVKTRGFQNKTLQKEMSASDFYLVNDLFPDFNKGTGAVVISAAAGAEFAFESDVWKNGVFTYSLLEGIRTGNADLNQDKKISVSELRNYVAKRVALLTGGRQNPTSRAENLENDFRVW